MDPLAAAVSRILSAQNGVISRRQVLAAGAAPHDIARRVRRREWSPLLPGVFVAHTGEPSWRQRAWAGVLYYWPAALADESAMQAVEGSAWSDPRGDRAPVVIAVHSARNVRARSGYRLRWVSGFETQVQSHVSPPRIRFEDAVLHVAARASDDWSAIETLASACGSRRTTPGRLGEAMARHARLPRRRWLAAVIDDLAEGTCSVLEHGFLTRVERPHGLPRPRRQPAGRLGDRRIYRDAGYEELALFVELDGRLFHESASVRDADLDRDLEAAGDGRLTVRLGWGQVFDRPCHTAARLTTLFQGRGWSGQPRRCGPACVL
ncbi:MAG TPA: hypothetical protein VH085_05715 [Nocardioides sp.]|nr:hypothetical protein [Nocardioides sp.]